MSAPEPTPLSGQDPAPTSGRGGGWPVGSAAPLKAPVWARPSGRDEPPPFGEEPGWLGPESIDWRVLDQTEIWIDGHFQRHRLEEMATDYLVNVVGYLVRRSPELELHCRYSSVCFWVRRPVTVSPLWRRLHELIDERLGVGR